jgi:hypothetical protein
MASPVASLVTSPDITLLAACPFAILMEAIALHKSRKRNEIRRNLILGIRM